MLAPVPSPMPNKTRYVARSIELLRNAGFAQVTALSRNNMLREGLIFAQLCGLVA